MIPIRLTSRPSQNDHNRRRTVQLQRRNLIRIPLVKSSLSRNVPSTKKRFLPNFMLANTRSLVRKRDELANIVKAYNLSLVFITETWLCDKIPNEAIQLPGMTVIRKDRTISKGSGLAI